MKKLIQLYSKGQQHAYEYEIETGDAEPLPTVVSPVNQTQRVFIMYPMTPGSTSYHEAEYSYCVLVPKTPVPVAKAVTDWPNIEPDKWDSMMLNNEKPSGE